MERESVRNSAGNSGALVATTPTPAPPAPAPVHAYTAPTHIEVRGARVHNLKNINVDIPLGCPRGHRGRIGLGQKLARARHSLRRGQPPLPRRALHLHAPAHRTGRPRHRRRGAPCAGSARPAPAPGHSRGALHLWHLHRAPQLPAPHVLAPRQPPVPPLRHPCAAFHGRRPSCAPPPAPPVARSSTAPVLRTSPLTARAPAPPAAARASCARWTSPRSCPTSRFPSRRAPLPRGSSSCGSSCATLPARWASAPMYRSATSRPKSARSFFTGPAEKHHMFYQSSKTGDVARWTLPTSTRSTRWRTRSLRSRTRRALRAWQSSLKRTSAPTATARASMRVPAAPSSTA